MNIDDYMDMQHDLAEADVIAFENEIDFLHKALDLACEYLWDNSICDCCPKQSDRDKCGCDICDVLSEDYKDFIFQKVRKEE